MPQKKYIYTYISLLATLILDFPKLLQPNIMKKCFSLFDNIFYYSQLLSVRQNHFPLSHEEKYPQPQKFGVEEKMN